MFTVIFDSACGQLSINELIDQHAIICHHYCKVLCLIRLLEVKGQGHRVRCSDR